ncbi:MAG: cytochrome c3 family protein [Candidatus Hydrothermales bacterium]
MKKMIIVVLVLSTFYIWLHATIVGSRHDFNRPNAGQVCIYCHTPHNANPSQNFYYLWNRVYVPTISALYNGTYTDPMTRASWISYACLSCHDGTQTRADLGTLYSFGPRNVGAAVQDPPDVTSGTNDTLIYSHPVDMDVAPGRLPPTKFNPPSTWGYPLYNFSGIQPGADSVMTCSTCHDPHNVDVAQPPYSFLRGDTTNSQICLDCHIK